MPGFPQAGIADGAGPAAGGASKWVPPPPPSS